MLKIERQKFLENYLKSKGSLIISQISKELDCSEETIRKDIIELEKQGVLVKTHGGAYLKEDMDRSFPLIIREILLNEEKNYIANMAIEYIKDKSIIFLDSSTTCFAIANKIIERALSLTVVTNSNSIVNILEKSDDIKIVVLGGEYRKRNKSFVGYRVTEAIETLKFDVSFLSFPTFDIKLGLGDNNYQELKVRETVMNHSKQVILAMDHTKFFDDSSTVYTKNMNFSILLTDKELPVEWKYKLENKEIRDKND